MNKIDPNLFQQTVKKNEEEKDCPQCDGKLRMRKGKYGLFQACLNYPDCDYIEALNQQDGHIVKTLDLPCPVCQQNLVLRQGRFGMFIGCSSYPKCQHIEKRDFVPSTPQNDEIKCPSCLQGKIHTKQSRFGKTFFACSCYPTCKFIVNLKPHKGTCEECGYALLVEQPQKSNEASLLLCARKGCGFEQKMPTE